MNLDLNLWYLDDGTIAGHPDDVLHALQTIIIQANEVGLELNHRKCEISFLGSKLNEECDQFMKLFQVVTPDIQEMQIGN